MIEAPIVLHQIVDGNISVQREPKYVIAKSRELATLNFDWSGINITTRFRFGHPDESPKNKKLFLLYLQVIVDNMQSNGESATKFCPYTIDIEKRAAVSMRPGINISGEPIDVIAVNGAGLIWSSIRELVLTLTARMANGPLTLPAVNFLDLIRDNKLIGKTPPKKVRMKSLKN